MSIHDVACLEAKQSGRLGQGRCGIKPLCMQELELASEDAKVYKLIGPTLIKQDPVEAKSNVNKRLEFIQGELSRLDARLAELSEQSGEAAAAGDPSCAYACCACMAPRVSANLQACLCS